MHNVKVYNNQYKFTFIIYNAPSYRHTFSMYNNVQFKYNEDTQIHIHIQHTQKNIKTVSR